MTSCRKLPIAMSALKTLSRGKIDGSVGFPETRHFIFGLIDKKRMIVKGKKILDKNICLKH